jgi:CheY-like chemotaxis protein/HPt (histidine-containing phosphotransfer) domain-containing protein
MIVDCGGETLQDPDRDDYKHNDHGHNQNHNQNRDDYKHNDHSHNQNRNQNRNHSDNDHNDNDHNGDQGATAVSAWDLAIVDEVLLHHRGISLPSIQRHFPQLPLIVLTTTDPARGEFKGTETGYATDLLKPITVTALAEAIVQVHPDLYLEHSPRPLSRQSPVGLSGSDGGYNWPHPTRLLLVEDSAINSAVVEGFLQQLGLEADWVNSGSAALEHLLRQNGHPYHLILMDCQMPELDGYETTRKIRQGEGGIAHQSIPIIALTAHALTGDREKCLAAGMNDYLTKPLALRALAHTLEQWLGDQGIPPDAASLSSPLEIPKDRDQPFASSLSPPVFDQVGLLDRTAGQMDLAQMMCERFLEGIPPELEKLHHLVHTNGTGTMDWGLVEQYAHRFKGSSSLVGAEQFRATATTLESLAKSRDETHLDHIRTLTQCLEEQFQIFRQEVQQL